MSWQTSIRSLVRVLVNDLDTPYTYSDARIDTFAVTAAYMMLTEASFAYAYTVNISAETISPDPSADEDFLTLSALYASYLIVRNEAKAWSLRSIRVEDGPSRIDVGKVYDNLTKLADQLFKQYNDALISYMAGNSIAGQAITGPDVVNFLDIRMGNF